MTSPRPPSEDADPEAQRAFPAPPIRAGQVVQVFMEHLPGAFQCPGDKAVTGMTSSTPRELAFRW